MNNPATRQCDICHQRPAELTITEVNKEGRTSEQRICAECAQARGVVAPGALKQTVAEILLELKNRIQDTDQRSLCANCGLSYAEFKTTGRLGCEHCYVAFTERLNPIIKRIHGASRHTGRAPQRNGKSAFRNFELHRLRRELKKAIAAEDYERAAAVRDQIHQVGGEEKETADAQ